MPSNITPLLEFPISNESFESYLIELGALKTVIQAFLNGSHQPSAFIQGHEVDSIFKNGELLFENEGGHNS